MGYVGLPSAQAAHHALWFLLGPQPDPAERMVKLVWWVSRALGAGSAEYGGNVPAGKLFSRGRQRHQITLPGCLSHLSHRAIIQRRVQRPLWFV